ncbi:MAG: glycosyltransferase family 4 protein [Leptolyngbya sp. SIO4C5]|uniref:glycosyltransferase family 4 protein n=1 Tax=Sphaerothrix gracilis TaxID=3151835 RepID=UPI0013C29B4F|nr:glycosyltransferase family 4 protein [Leptolyngbya sp. SIO4C5]
MRIAQVAPLWERVPPPAYGGIELVVSFLTDELVRRHHDVTLFATGDSQTEAELVAAIAEPIRGNEAIEEPMVYEMIQLQQLLERLDNFDIIHIHKWIPPLPIAHIIKRPTVYTMHSNFGKDHRKLYTRYPEQNFVSISRAQQDLAPQLNYIATVYNGIDPGRFPFVEQPQDPPYLAFLGRMSPNKGPHHAIAVAKQLGLPLKLAGKVDKKDRDYFEQEVAAHFDEAQIQYLGEVNHAEKTQLLGHAIATLFPITWHEPFGLVMVESMATGTPVVAMRMGAVPEVIEPGKTGFICNDVEDMISSVSQVDQIDRRRCRQRVEQHFSYEAMTDSYLAVYEQVLSSAPPQKVA